MSASETMFGTLKPRYPEAVARLRNSLVALVFFAVATHLLPTPSLPLALYKFLRSSYASSWERKLVIGELSLLSILATSMIQASWGIYFPRRQTRTTVATTPTAKQASDDTPHSWRRAGSVLSPNTTPQRQRPFAVPTTSDPRGLATSYSLPFIQPSPADTSLNTSTTSFPPSPSPSPLAAYRGRRSAASPGHALDESVLARLNRETQVEED